MEDLSFYSSLRTLQKGTNVTDESHAATAQVLSNGNLLKEDGNSAEDHGNEISNKEGTCKKEKNKFQTYCLQNK